MRGLRWLWREKIRSVFQADRFDLLAWKEGLEIFPKAGEENEKASKELGGNPVQDAFLGLYKVSPELRQSVETDLVPLKLLMEKAIETPGWKKLRETTVGDIPSSIVSTYAFWEETMKNLPNEVKKKAEAAKKKAEEAEKKKEQADALKNLLQEIEDKKPDIAEEIRTALEKTEREAELARKEASEALSSFEEAAEKNKAKIASALNQGAEKARKEAKDTREMVRSFSLAAGGDPQIVDPRTAKAAMEALSRNPNLRRLAEMIGWARRTVRGVWRKSPKGRTVMVGYKTHDLRLEYLASFELLSLFSGIEALRLDFLRRAADGAIVHRHYEGKEKQNRGEMIIVRDESASMKGAPHSLAVALEWALLGIARREGRRFISIPFSGVGQYHVWEAPTTHDPEGLLEHLSHFYGGGTEPYQAIEEAVKQIQEGRHKADILVITDSSFSAPSKEFLMAIQAKKRKTPFRIYTVVIGSSIGPADRFSDMVIRVSDLIQERDKLLPVIERMV